MALGATALDKAAGPGETPSEFELLYTRTVILPGNLLLTGLWSMLAIVRKIQVGERSYAVQI